MASSRSDDERRPTPDNALNALSDLLRDVLEGLTVVELFAGRGRVSKRFLQEGAQRAVCVDAEPPADRGEAEGLIWLEMDVMDFLGEQRVRDVGLIYSAPPYGSEWNKNVLQTLPELTILQRNCLVLLEEATWDHTSMREFSRFEVVETFEFNDTRITVTQMVDPMEPGAK